MQPFTWRTRFLYCAWARTDGRKLCRFLGGRTTRLQGLLQGVYITLPWEQPFCEAVKTCAANLHTKGLCQFYFLRANGCSLNSFRPPQGSTNPYRDPKLSAERALLRELGLDRRWSGVGSALFAAHPVHVPATELEALHFSWIVANWLCD